MVRTSGKIADFSQNLLTTAADLVLFKIYLGAPFRLVGESDGEGSWEGLEGSFPDLPELAPSKIERALRFLLKRGYIELVPSEAHLVPQITEEGGKRLDEAFPVYQEERPWDQKFYLVNYDIPVGKNSKRDALRRFLKEELGCEMLQSSVWITPYNPVKKLSEFVKKRDLGGRVVVSVLLDEWEFGKSNFLKIMEEVYGLEEINRRYREFVGRAGGIEGLKDDEKMMLAFDYFAILRDDPQLPFELLPEDWAGGRAQGIFEELFFGK